MYIIYLGSYLYRETWEQYRTRDGFGGVYPAGSAQFYGDFIWELCMCEGRLRDGTSWCAQVFYVTWFREGIIG